MALARAHHMNTDVKRSVFCILLSCEDYLDAFEKIKRLNIKGIQERDLVNVIIYCCEQVRFVYITSSIFNCCLLVFILVSVFVNYNLLGRRIQSILQQSDGQTLCGE
jgi:hypothetical protein